MMRKMESEIEDLRTQLKAAHEKLDQLSKKESPRETPEEAEARKKRKKF